MMSRGKWVVAGGGGGGEGRGGESSCRLEDLADRSMGWLLFWEDEKSRTKVTLDRDRKGDGTDEELELVLTELEEAVEKNDLETIER